MHTCLLRFTFVLILGIGPAIAGTAMADMDAGSDIELEPDSLEADQVELPDMGAPDMSTPDVTLTSVMPTRVEAASGARILFEGTGFVFGTRAFIGLSFMEEPFYSSQESMSWNIPLNLPPGLYDARVESPDGQVAELPGAIEVVESMTAPAPLIVSVTPDPVESGSEVVVDGAAFQDGAAVVFDDRFSMSVTFMDTSELRAVVPADLPLGDYDVYVINPSGRTGQSPDRLSVIGPPPPTDPGDEPDDCACSSVQRTEPHPTGLLLTALAFGLLLTRRIRE